MTTEALAEKRKLFATLYEVNFGEWPGKKSEEHAKEWFRLVDSVPLDQIRPLFDRAKQNRKGNFRIFAPAFWDAWQEIQPQQRKSEMPIQACGMCDEGLMRFVAVRNKKEDGRFEYHIGVTDKGPLTEWVIPCFCSAGEWRWRHDRSPMDDDLRKQVFDWRIWLDEEAKARPYPDGTPLSIGTIIWELKKKARTIESSIPAEQDPPF